MKLRTTIILLSFLLAIGLPQTLASNRQYTKESPLVYEDSWSMWPFSFINEEGEPDGFNVELVRDVMQRLNIPLCIHLCSLQSAREDIHSDHASLFIGMKNSQNAIFGQFGHSVITTVSFSMITPRRDSLPGIGLVALENMHFAVRKGSFAHKYLDQNGLYPSMKPMDNIDVVIREVAVRDSGAVLWSTPGLAWVRQRYHLDNLALSKVDLPIEELHFMSNDENLLHRADSVVEVIRSQGGIAELENKWFHDGDTHHHDAYNWSGFILVVAIFLGFIVLVHGFVYYYRRRMEHRLEDTVSQMQLTLIASHAKVWAYDPFEHCYSWMNSKGETAETYTAEEFRRFYPDDEFDKINDQVHSFLIGNLTPVDINLRGYSLTESDEIITLQVHMEAMRTEYKRIYLVVGVQHQLG